MKPDSSNGAARMKSAPVRTKASGALRVVAFCLLCVSFLIFSAGDALAAKKSKPNPRYASVIMDADTGVILSESNANKALHPASLVKMMTLVMVFDALESGKLSLRDRVTVSRHAAAMSPSKLGLSPGATIRVEDAIYALVTKSANDIAVALGEKIGGTESNFASMMTQRARQIGMTRSRFANASGLHNPRQVSTARDMAKLARFILTEYPQYYHYFSTRNFTYRGVTHRNHNRLMEAYRGMDGFKTGFIGPSGFNLVASAKRGNRRLIGVVFGGRTASSRNTHMAALLDQGFAKTGQDDIEIASATPVPLPRRKPSTTEVASTNQPRPPAVHRENSRGDSSQWTELGPYLAKSGFSSMIGEGDYDPADSRRVETGLMAIAAIKENAGTPTENWAVQIGAFGSRVKTDQALKKARESLPARLADASPVIAPLKTKTGWLFRGRLTGYTKEQAAQACKYLPDCLPVSPRAY